jgi:hypothetical protein
MSQIIIELELVEKNIIMTTQMHYNTMKYPNGTMKEHVLIAYKLRGKLKEKISTLTRLIK